MSDKTLKAEEREKIGKLVDTSDFAAAQRQVDRLTNGDSPTAAMVFFSSQLLVIQNNPHDARELLQQAWKRGSRDHRITAALAQQWLNYQPTRLFELSDRLAEAEGSSLYVPLHPMAHACAVFAKSGLKSAEPIAVADAKGDKTLLGFFYGKCAEILFLNQHALESLTLTEKAVEVSPTPEKAWLLNLSTIYLQQKQYDKVRTYAQKLVELDPQNTDGWDKLSVACFRLNDYAAAQNALLKLKALDPSPQVIERLRQVEANLGATPKT
jgi:tetratricopeptide (TPR) repeat protein